MSADRGVPRRRDGPVATRRDLVALQDWTKGRVLRLLAIRGGVLVTCHATYALLSALGAGTGQVIPAALRNRARAAYRATSYAEGDNTWNHFVAKAIEAETARREAEHNEGEMYPSWGENLPGGRRGKDS
jgi:hypothetical protein